MNDSVIVSQNCDRLSQFYHGADENRSIGIILCAEKDRVEVELALEEMGKPIGVADYQLIVPQEELKKVVAEEVEAFGKEFPLRAETEEPVSLL